MKWLHIYIITALITLQFFVVPVPLTAENLKKHDLFFEVKEIHGRVFMWSDEFAVWKNVRKKAKLKKGTIIQLHEGAVISLYGKENSYIGGGGEASLLTIKAPTIVRLDENLFKKVKLDEHFLGELPSLAKETEEKEKDLVMFLEDAWERVSAMVITHPEDQNKMGLSDKNSNDMSLSLKANELKLLSPTRDAMIYTLDLPIDLKVIWGEVPEKNARYKIYLWNMLDPRPTPTVITNGDYYTIKVAKEGSYFVQVTSVDEAWQSVPRKIHVSHHLSKFLSERKRITEADGQDLLIPKFPMDEISITSQRNRTDITFAWDAPLIGNLVGKTVNLVVIPDDVNRKKIEKTVINQNWTKIPLIAGGYKWHLEAVFLPEAAKKSQETSTAHDDRFAKETSVKSLEYTFTIQPIEAKKSDLISQALSGKGSQVIYFSH